LFSRRVKQLTSLTQELRALGLGDGMTVLMNASLRSLGHIEGGAATVVQAIQEVLGPAGTLVTPATTEENSDTSRAYLARIAGMSPQQALAFRAAMPAFDPATTPASCGRIAEEIRTTPGAVRSAHPQSSFAAIGAGARDLMAGHALECHHGKASPLGKLYEAEAWVLLLGVEYRTCTALHLAEYLYRPDPPPFVYRCVIRDQGRRVWKEYTDVVLDDSDFEVIGELIDAKVVYATGYIGQAHSRLMPMREAVDLATDWMSRNRTRPENMV
jgi:aminoglycoside 3-N-acetyltransferase